MEDTERWAPWPHLHQRFGKRKNQRRLLALDGGGIRGLITLEVLAKLERELSLRLNAGPNFRLADYFDYVGGTSTGAIIAAGISQGLRIADLIDLYESLATEIFAKRPLFERWKSLYGNGPLEKALKRTFGKATLEPVAGGCLLLAVLRNATTDSAWPLSSNPFAKYNDPERPDCNLKLPLWQIVRASAAAPVYFPPEDIVLGDKHFTFVDGGTTAYNNPAFLLYRMATSPAYRLGWESSESAMLLVSIGTGSRPVIRSTPVGGEPNVAAAALETLQAVMGQSVVDQDLSCRTIGRCTYGTTLDREIGDLVPPEPLTQDLGRKFLYVRYDAELTDAGLGHLGFSDLDPELLSKLDGVDQLHNLQAIGVKVAQQVDLAHFGSFV